MTAPGGVTPEQYHDATKHHFDRFASSRGFLDWASQPAPFRSFAGAPVFPLSPPVGTEPGHTAASDRAAITYDRLYATASSVGAPVSLATIGDVLRHALGLSAWKQFGASRWALRVNPSSGNLHPTESYVVVGPLPGLGAEASVCHYAPERHALEQRVAVDMDRWVSASGVPPDVWLVALTSIHWREAWKYGERAFRYCQHDMGHAIAAVRLAAGLVGWTVSMLPEWSQADIAALVGADRDEDFVDAEREVPGCLLAVTRDGVVPGDGIAPRPLVDAVRHGRWTGRASRLSDAHVDWRIIDDVAQATEDPGREPPAREQALAAIPPADRQMDARRILLQRRSAVAFDGTSSIDRATLMRMLGRAMPSAGAPWDALWWTPRVHFALFVHRVTGLEPGLYVLPRDPSALDRLKGAFGREFLWEPADAGLPLVRLARGDCRRLAQRLSCDQDIAADGCFSLGMIADFEASLREHGPSFYRHLFWESGVVGQVLYL